MSLYLPERAAREMHQKNEEYRHEVLQHTARKHVMDEFNRDLKQIDERLELVQAHPNANQPGLTPGYWHIMRVQDGLATLIPLEGPDGEYREPGSWMFDMLRRNDLWHSEAANDRKKRRKALEDAERRRKALEREALAEEVEERFKAATRAQVLMSPDVPWSQNAAGRRGRR